MEKIKTKEVTTQLPILMSSSSRSDLEGYFVEFEIEDVFKSHCGNNLFKLVNDITLKSFSTIVGEEYLKSIVDEDTFNKIKEIWKI
jgi:hypothetical protein